MRFPFYINPTIIAQAFERTKVLLTGKENILYDSMNNVHNSFILPTNPSQFDIKNQEINRILSRIGFAGGLDLNFRLIDEILHRFIALNTDESDLIDLVNNWIFEFYENSFIELRFNEKWYYKHSIEVRDSNNLLTHEYILPLRDYTLGVIVPDYIIQYFQTAVNCFKQNQYAVCLALSSIIVEGTLKDILITRGYQFENRRQPNYVGGLGTALDKARNTEVFLTSADFPSDFDNVVQPIRNNLVHLSGAAFSTPLVYLNGYDNVANFTLGDYIKYPILVHDLLQSVAHLVDKMYTDLRNNGHIVP